jgi:hypothetical protein
MMETAVRNRGRLFCVHGQRDEGEFRCIWPDGRNRAAQILYETRAERNTSDLSADLI